MVGRRKTSAAPWKNIKKCRPGVSVRVVGKSAYSGRSGLIVRVTGSIRFVHLLNPPPVSNFLMVLEPGLLALAAASICSQVIFMI
jgi:hypothetical protein